MTAIAFNPYEPPSSDRPQRRPPFLSRRGWLLIAFIAYVFARAFYAYQLGR